MIDTEKIHNLLTNGKLNIEKRQVFGFVLIECYTFQNELVFCVEHYNTGRCIIRDKNRLMLVEATKISDLGTEVLSLIQKIEQQYTAQQAEKDKRYAEYLKRRQILLKQLEELDNEWNKTH